MFKAISDSFFDFPVNVIVAELVPALFLVALSLWLIIHGIKKRMSRKRGGVGVVVGLVLLFGFGSFLTGIVSRHGYHRRVPVYSAIYERRGDSDRNPPNAIPDEIVKAYCSENFECSLDLSGRPLRLPPEFVPGTRPEWTSFLMPLVYDRAHPDLMREALAVANGDFLLAFNRFQRKLVQMVDSWSETDLEALVDASALPELVHYDRRSGFRYIPSLFCSLKRRPDETPSVLFRPLFPEERRLLGRTVPSSSNRHEQVFMCGVFSRVEGPVVGFPVMYDEGSFRLFAPSLWHYQPKEVSEIGGKKGLSASPRILPCYRSDGTRALERSLLVAMQTGKGAENLPVLDDDNALRGELREDSALLSKAFGTRQTNIRFHPALGPELDRIRGCVYSRTRQRPRLPTSSGAPEPESPLSPTGVWVVAEAVVDSFRYEWPVATWYAVETDDGVCRLASSAFSQKEPPSPEVIGAFRAAEEKRIRLLVSDGRVRELSDGIVWDGSCPCAFLVLEMARGWDGNPNPMFPSAEPVEQPPP